MGLSAKANSEPNMQCDVEEKVASAIAIAAKLDFWSGFIKCPCTKNVLVQNVERIFSCTATWRAPPFRCRNPPIWISRHSPDERRLGQHIARWEALDKRRRCPLTDAGVVLGSQRSAWPHVLRRYVRFGEDPRRRSTAAMGASKTFANGSPMADMGSKRPDSFRRWSRGKWTFSFREYRRNGRSSYLPDTDSSQSESLFANAFWQSSGLGPLFAQEIMTEAIDLLG